MVAIDRIRFQCLLTCPAPLMVTVRFSVSISGTTNFSASTVSDSLPVCSMKGLPAPSQLDLFSHTDDVYLEGIYVVAPRMFHNLQAELL